MFCLFKLSLLTTLSDHANPLTPYANDLARKQNRLIYLWLSRGRLFASCSLRKAGRTDGGRLSGTLSCCPNCGCLSFAFLLWRIFRPKVVFASHPEGLDLAIEPFPSFPGLCGGNTNTLETGMIPHRVASSIQARGSARTNICASGTLSGGYTRKRLNDIQVTDITPCR